MNTTVGEPIIVAGSLAQRPRHGGHAWVFLQYLLGFRRLGYDVYFVDRLEPGMCVAEDGSSSSFRASANLRYLSSLMETFGLGDRWTLLYDGGREVAGRGRADLIEAARRSALLLNVMGFLNDEEILAATPLRVFLDIDPGFGQIWHELNLDRPFEGHDRHVTVGTAIGTPECVVPTCGIEWTTILPPVELSQWPAVDGPGNGFRSVVSWRGPFDPLEYEGRTFGLRVHEFRRFTELPERAAARFAIALDIDETDAADRDRLHDHGWRLDDPISAAGDPWRYRDYVQESSAELMIAKNLYVDTRSGWFSDRSACYLASGRPVLAQDTGFSSALPCGEGLLTFSTPDEAASGVERILGDYAHHGRAARALAEEHLAADRLLPRLLETLGAA